MLTNRDLVLMNIPKLGARIWIVSKEELAEESEVHPKRTVLEESTLLGDDIRQLKRLINVIQTFNGSLNRLVRFLYAVFVHGQTSGYHQLTTVEGLRQAVHGVGADNRELDRVLALICASYSVNDSDDLDMFMRALVNMVFEWGQRHKALYIVPTGSDFAEEYPVKVGIAPGRPCP
jgi:hypothetical protein